MCQACSIIEHMAEENRSFEMISVKPAVKKQIQLDKTLKDCSSYSEYLKSELDVFNKGD